MMTARHPDAGGYDRGKFLAAIRALCCVGMLSIAGCGESASTSTQRFIPAEADAQRALASVLEDWKAGRPASENDPKAEIVFVDSERRNGQVLEDYRILGPQPWDRGRRFVVEIKLRSSDAPQKVRFVVLGKSPLLVFRQDDFDRLANWMHPMESDPAASPPVTAPAATPSSNSPDSSPAPSPDSTPATDSVESEDSKEGCP